MPPSSDKPCGGLLSRRGFLVGAGLGLGIGLPAGWMAHLGSISGTNRFSGRTRENPRADLGMPGRWPGRVIEVRRPGSVRGDGSIAEDNVRTMMARGMENLTGADAAPDAWRTLFERGDVVGIKVNPVGRKPRSGEGGRVRNAIECISHPEVILETVRCLKEYCGIPPRDIILFERYAEEFREAGYERLLFTRPMAGVRWYACAHAYDGTQVAIDGQAPGFRDPHVLGYDPDQFVSMGFAAPEHDRRDDRRHRSHLSMVVSRLVNKVITIPCLKDHKSAGVTLALKNISHGMNNNVARSHLAGIYRIGGGTSGPNQCNTFIPTAVAQEPIRRKMTLHILDGLVGVYEGGPGNWNRSWGTWNRESLFFATDPVALDHVGWAIIDARRAQEGWAPVGHMGLVQEGPQVRMAPPEAVAALSTPLAAAALTWQAHQRRRRFSGEPFDRRQPEHVALAGLLGLGRFDPAEIEHRQVVLR